MTEKPTRIAIIDDSPDARTILDRLFEGIPTVSERLLINFTAWDEGLRKQLETFNPNLIISDLLLGESREEGMDLIRKISKVESLKSIPIAVCSKLINESEPGRSVQQLCLKLPGVVAAVKKFPPPAADFLSQITYLRLTYGSHPYS